MKKSTKNILIALAVTVVLGGGVAALYLTEPKDEVVDSQSDTVVEEETSIISKDTTVTKFTITNPTDEFIINATHNDILYDFALDVAPEYKLEDLDISKLADQLVTLNYERKVGEVTSLDDYGLGKDGTKLDTEYADGSKSTIVVGIDASETSGKYVLYEGEVYIIDINEVVLSAKEDLFEHTLWVAPTIYDPQGYDASYISKLNLTGTNFPQEISLEYTGGLMEYTMTSPVTAQGDASLSGKLLETLSTISAESVAAIYPTDEQLEEFGLKEPFAEIEYTVNDEETFKITVGNKISGYRYVCVKDDFNIVYLMNSDQVAKWAELDENEYRSPFVLVLEINKIENLKLEMGDLTTDIAIDATLPEGETSYTYECTRDGEFIDFQSVSDFYMEIITIGSFSLNKVVPVGESLLTITYDHADGSPQTVVEFFQGDGETERYACYIDGKYSATVKKASLDTFRPKLESFIEKEPVIEE